MESCCCWVGLGSGLDKSGLFLVRVCPVRFNFWCGFVLMGRIGWEFGCLKFGLLDAVKENWLGGQRFKVLFMVGDRVKDVKGGILLGNDWGVMLLSGLIMMLFGCWVGIVDWPFGIPRIMRWSIVFSVLVLIAALTAGGISDMWASWCWLWLVEGIFVHFSSILLSTYIHSI
jgi:hypothetical protein